MREGLKADLGKDLPRSLLRFLRAQTLRCAQGQGDVAKRIEMGEEAKILENETRPAAGSARVSAPPSSASRPTRHRRSDDFPAPEGPRRQRCWPEARVRDRCGIVRRPRPCAPRKGEHHGAHAGRPDAAKAAHRNHQGQEDQQIQPRSSSRAWGWPRGPEPGSPASIGPAWRPRKPGPCPSAR